MTKFKEVNNNILGIAINWGRSAIEKKSIQGPIEHIKETTKHNLLYGLMFSGTSNNDHNLYGRWSDLHMPPAEYKNYEYFEKESLMTHNTIKQSLSVAKLTSLSFLGIKLLAKPENSSIEKRIKINKNSMLLLDDVLASLRWCIKRSSNNVTQEMKLNSIVTFDHAIISPLILG